MAFARDRAGASAEDRQRALTTIVYASDLREEAAFGVGSRTGLTLFAVPVYSAATTVGTYYLLLVRDAQGAVGTYRHWDGEAGATGATITAELRMSWSPTDAPAAAAPGLDAAGVRAQVQAQLAAGTGITLTPAGAGASRTLTVAATAATAASEALLTPSAPRAAWGGLGSSAAPRAIAAPAPVTVTLAADGTLPDGVTLASSVLTLRDAGRVQAATALQVEAWNTAAGAGTGGNNSRSRVGCWWERAASGSTAYAALDRSRADTYIRAAKPYWNHGPGEGWLRPDLAYLAAAGDRLRLRCAATYRQAATIQHAVIGGSIGLLR